ncbi:MAG: hypothetical protein MZV70_19110 [Desulfobacterales bacterium]|nr:hypothetical protein [Desulfobacterales bacterium]
MPSWSWVHCWCRPSATITSWRSSSNSFFYIVLCLGLNIVVGFAGLLDLGYAAFFAVGAYTTGILTSHYGWNFWLTIPAALVFCHHAPGWSSAAPTLRLRSDYLAIVTLGFGEITRIVARNLKDITGGAQRPDRHQPAVPLRPGTQPDPALLLRLLCPGPPGDLRQLPRSQHSRLGRAWQYVREDEDAAEAMGIDRVAIKLYAYIIGAVFAGVAGCFFAAKMTAISPETFQFMQSATILMAVVLGGMGKIPGMVVGALALVLFPEVFREIGSMRMLVFGVVLIAHDDLQAPGHLARAQELSGGGGP